jgi:hypothetical protein
LADGQTLSLAKKLGFVGDVCCCAVIVAVFYDSDNDDDVDDVDGPLLLMIASEICRRANVAPLQIVH